MKVIALVNTAAGSVGNDGRRRMQKALANSGLENAQVMAFDPDKSVRQVDDILNQSPDLVIVWGGDGTHRAVLRAAGCRFEKLILLPGGTMNLLTKWIHGAHPWDRILRSVLAGSKLRTLPAGLAGVEPFFCALLAGVPAKLAQAREDMRVGDFGRAIQDVGVAVESAHHLHLDTRIDAAAGVEAGDLGTGNVVAALVGPLSRTKRMEVAGMNLPSAAAALTFAWSSIRSDWHQLEGIQIRSAETLTIIGGDDESVPAIMDGEMVDLGSRITVRFTEVAARCLVANA